MLEQQIKEIRKEVQLQFQLQKKLFRLRAIEIISGYLGQIIGYAALAIFGALLLTFGSFALAFYLNTVYESFYIGFLWVTGMYGVLFILLYLFRKQLFQVVMRNALIANLMELWTDSNPFDTDE